MVGVRPGQGTKKMITTLQITQLLCGNLFGVIYWPPVETWHTFMTQIAPFLLYVIALTGLFIQFYIQSYAKQRRD